ncbi:MAG: hypothetical protein AMS18_13605 [Gemmatimonas sp. SG8_17]|nr:MAG: hypothetical protein AMS18_13605 [Gemmatimonas sp. SG8_17]
MHITLVTVGSTGDIWPYVALGIGLKRAGHHVRLATHAHFAPLVQERGLEFSPVEGDPRQVVESDRGQAWLNTGEDPLAFARHMAEVMRPTMSRALGDYWKACQAADVVIYSILGWLAAHHIVEKLQIPGIAAYLQPMTPTGEFPAPVSLALPRLGRSYNRLTYLAGEQVYWMFFRRSLNQARKEVLDLPPLGLRAPFARIRRQRLPLIYGYSPAVVPRPPDWPPWIHVTGYWFLDRPSYWEAPSDLVDFLQSGPPPVYVGFGSMRTQEVGKVTAVVLDALARSGQRGIISSGWGGICPADLPDYAWAVESVPHDWLFPQTAAVVHHAGAGTTAAGLRAGVPTVSVPFFGDQHFWARRVHALGAGPRPIPLRRLSADRLAEAIRVSVSSSRIRASSGDLGRRLRTEDGVGGAVEAIEEYLTGASSQGS